jgi:putative Mg2+ transporter-C (MgtC) family protein
MELDLDWPRTGTQLFQIAVAFLLAAPLGWERESAPDAPGAGLRTFPLVAAGSCAYLLIAQAAFEGSESQARVLYGLMTGIGFIGGGSILKTRASVAGTATAASIWNTGAIAAAVAWHRYDLALALCVVSILTLQLGRALKPLARPSGGERG